MGPTESKHHEGFNDRRIGELDETMRLTAIGLALGLALALGSTTAFALGGGAGVSGGTGPVYNTGNPADCGGLVCFAKPFSASTGKRLRGVKRHQAWTR